MGVHAGPDISESGLVLAFDAGNYKNSRSSVSTNLVSNGSFANGLGSPNESGSNPTNTIVQLENPGETPFVLRQNGNNTEYQLNISGLTASTTYVMSGWYAKSSDYNGGDTMFHARTFSLSGAHIATGNDIGTLIRSVTLGSTIWEYRYQTIVTPSDPSGYMEWYLGYGTNNTVGYRYYTNLKFEKGTFPGLLNMIGDLNHGTPTNGLSYNSANGGSIAFDGADDVVNSTTSIIDRADGQEITVSCWIKPSRTSGQYSVFCTNRSDNTNIYNWIFYQHTTDGAIAFHGDAQNKSSYVPTINVWINVTNTVTASGVSTLYVNGVSTYTVTGYTYGNGTPSRLGIGADPGGQEPFQGNISQVQIYNRALTAAEVQQNFNALRGRFGV